MNTRSKWHFHKLAVAANNGDVALMPLEVSGSPFVGRGPYSSMFELLLLILKHTSLNDRR